jgi:hypothetical protein
MHPEDAMPTPLDTIQAWFDTLDPEQQLLVAFQVVTFWCGSLSEPESPSLDWIDEFVGLLTSTVPDPFAVAGRAMALSALIDFVLMIEASPEGLAEGRWANECLLQEAKERRAESLVSMTSERLARWDLVAARWMNVGDAWRACRAGALSLVQIGQWLRNELADDASYELAIGERSN